MRPVAIQSDVEVCVSYCRFWTGVVSSPLQPTSCTTTRPGCSWRHLTVYLTRKKQVPGRQHHRYVAVPDRNRILVHHVFRAHQRVQRATALSFCLRRGSYALRERIRYSCVYIAHMSPTLSGSSALQRASNSVMRSKYATE